MPKKSKLTECADCHQRPVEVGMVRSFYLLKTADRSPDQPQLRGSFPASGLCAGCFLKAADQSGMDLKNLEGRLRRIEKHRSRRGKEK